MTRAIDDIPVAYVRSLLTYDPKTGLVRWLTTGKGRNLDRLAGTQRSRGDISVSISGKRYRAHRIAWALMTGAWPTKQIDHKDLNPSNNRWENLREADNSENNSHRPAQRNNTSGYKGVSWHERGWRAVITKDGHHTELGFFSSPEEASEAYKRAATLIHGEFAYTGH